jgi:hypothetical protein
MNVQAKGCAHTSSAQAFKILLGGDVGFLLGETHEIAAWNAYPRYLLSWHLGLTHEDKWTWFVSLDIWLESYEQQILALQR